MEKAQLLLVWVTLRTFLVARNWWFRCVLLACHQQYCSLSSSIVPFTFFASRCARTMRRCLGPRMNKIVTCGMEYSLSSRTFSQDPGFKFALEMKNLARAADMQWVVYAVNFMRYEREPSAFLIADVFGVSVVGSKCWLSEWGAERL